MSAARRSAAERRGRQAERWAGWLLRLKGYRVLDRRWRGRGGEIDLVVRRGAVLAFVEVKMREDAGRAAAACRSRSRRASRRP